MHLSLRLTTAALLLCACPVAFAQDSCLQIKRALPQSVDLQRIKSTWLGWVNEERESVGAKVLVSNDHLSATAGNWSTFASKRGTIDHKRYGGAPYYDFNGIGKWFSGKGLTFAKEGGMTFGESIGWGTYRCTESDCTDELIEQIRSTFDFFHGEKAANGVHYRMMVNRAYGLTGIGIAINEKQGRYYLTAHYATSISSDPVELCEASAT